MTGSLYFPTFLLCTLFLITSFACRAAPISEQYILRKQTPLAEQSKRYTLPLSDSTWAARFREVRINREGYHYGPPLLGNTSFFPTGPLGDAMVQRDKQLWLRDAQFVTDNVEKELPLAGQALAAVLQTPFLVC